MDFGSHIVILTLALIVETMLGYPDRFYATFGHPVTWIGRLIGALDRDLNREADEAFLRRAAGLLAVLLLLVITVGGAIGCLFILSVFPYGLKLLLLGILASSLVAANSLDKHVYAVAAGLETRGLQGGRFEVAKIVGRDPESLDEHGVARAAIESLAENFSDGVVAPLFWGLVGGLPGIVAYKAINTADSMIGHRTPRHEAFGWAAARLDDAVNLPASRLTGLLLIAAAKTLPQADAAQAWQAVRRDAGKHRSPNAGWPEAAMAGALGLSLAGPRVYHGKTVHDAMMGDGRREATARDIRLALALYRRANAMLLITFGLLTGLVIVTML